MADLDDRLEDLVETLKRERDELRVQVHLAKAEAREEWEELEERFEHLQGRLAAVRKEAAEASEDIGSALGLLADELREGYRRVAARLKG